MGGEGAEVGSAGVGGVVAIGAEPVQGAQAVVRGRFRRRSACRVGGSGGDGREDLLEEGVAGADAAEHDLVVAVLRPNGEAVFGQNRTGVDAGVNLVDGDAVLRVAVQQGEQDGYGRQSAMSRQQTVVDVENAQAVDPEQGLPEDLPVVEGPDDAVGAGPGQRRRRGR